MDKDYELKYHQQEHGNWWFVSRRRLIVAFLEKYHIAKDARIIDIGCSGGELLADLMQLGYDNLYALDYSEEAIRICREKGISNAYVMDGHNPEFPEGYFDLIIASDSLEHLKDDQLALANWSRILKPGGLLFVFVPAFMFLWSHHDDINYHYRRYTRKELKTKLRQSGLDIVQSGYWNTAVFLPTLAVRMLEKITGRNKKAAEKSDAIVVMPEALNRLMINVISIENFFCKNSLLPVGVSTFTIARK